MHCFNVEKLRVSKTAIMQKESTQVTVCSALWQTRVDIKL